MLSLCVSMCAVCVYTMGVLYKGNTITGVTPHYLCRIRWLEAGPRSWPQTSGGQYDT